MIYTDGRRMDLDCSIEFLLQQQVKTEVQLQAIRDLVQGGMKLVIPYQAETNRRLDALIDAQLRSEERISRLAEAQLITGQKVARLADTQETTELKLQALIDSLKQPKNGNPN